MSVYFTISNTGKTLTIGLPESILSHLPEPRFFKITDAYWRNFDAVVGGVEYYHFVVVIDNTPPARAKAHDKLRCKRPENDRVYLSALTSSKVFPQGFPETGIVRLQGENTPLVTRNLGGGVEIKINIPRNMLTDPKPHRVHSRLVDARRKPLEPVVPRPFLQLEKEAVDSLSDSYGRFVDRIFKDLPRPAASVVERDAPSRFTNTVISVEGVDYPCVIPLNERIALISKYQNGE